MRILLVGALAWNPERIRSLSEQGHVLWGLWSRSLAWDQGPYPALEGCVQPITLEDAARTIREEKIDCVYSLFQVYDRRLWAPASPGIEHGVWTILRTLLLERERGGFDAPVVRHWGSDVHDVDLDVARALDGHIFCNRAKLTYWTTPPRDGGCGLDVTGDGAVVEFLDGDRPKLEFMNDRFVERLSDEDGELHTVCVGRPVGIDCVALARRGIHLHVYCNSYDDAYRMIAPDLSPRDARREAALLGRYLHVHTSLQTLGGSWAEVRRTKERWVEEFSRYDAGWSYIGSPLSLGAARRSRGHPEPSRHVSAGRPTRHHRSASGLVPLRGAPNARRRARARRRGLRRPPRPARGGATDARQEPRGAERAQGVLLRREHRSAPRRPRARSRDVLRQPAGGADAVLRPEQRAPRPLQHEPPPADSFSRASCSDRPRTAASRHSGAGCCSRRGRGGSAAASSRGSRSRARLEDRRARALLRPVPAVCSRANR